MKNNKKDEGKLTAVHIRIFVIVITVAVVINVCALAAGAVFLTRSISSAVEEDMLVAVDIADKYITKEIELLKFKAANAAKEINLLYAAAAREGQVSAMLARVCADYPEYSGLAVFNSTGLLDSCGKITVPGSLIHEPFMQAIWKGESVISSTMYSPDGSLVMYVSARINGTLALAAVLPGFHLNNLISKTNFWQTGHLYTWDEKGTVISNIRPHWVQQRNNFFQMAKEDKSFEGVASVITRGIAGERGIGHYSIEDVPRICAFRPVSSPNENWFIGIVAPLGESALGDIPRSILLMGLITLLLSAAAAVVAAILLKRPYDEIDYLRVEAEATSSSKTAFLANISHEIRTPMNSIVGFSELALDSEASFKTRDYLNKIQTNAEWLLQIINDILDISKVEAGKMDLENIPFDMHELFSSCRTIMMPKAVEKGIQLYFYVEPSIGKKPLGDPTRLRQVIINLLSNAIKFTNIGMVKLQAALKDMSHNRITMQFEVKDSGIGMTKEQINNIFDPFTQVDTGTTRQYGGAGLGLAITKTIVELMGGKLSVESTLGVGSKFSFEITFDTIDITYEETFEKKIVLNELEKPNFEGEILLCEDNPMNQQVICEHLSRIGIKTIVAENGKIGLDLVINRKEKGEKQFDLIFMDMHMPVMDGLEASAKIMELNVSIPIVAMTANIMANEREIYKMNGMYDCVGKPFTSQELWRCLMKYFTPKKKDGQKNVQLEADLEFQRSLHVLFVKNNQAKYVEIIRALEEGDVQLAHRFAHTLKSNAGQIGKTLLQQAAASVEAQLKEGRNRVKEEQLKILETELNVVLNEFAPLLEETAAKTESTRPYEAGKTKGMFEKLETLLKSGNPDCRNFENDIRSIPGNSDLKNKLIQQMEDFEFLTALSTLRALKERIG